MLECRIGVVALTPPRRDERFDVGLPGQFQLLVDRGVVGRVVIAQGGREGGVGEDPSLCPGVGEPGVEEGGLDRRRRLEGRVCRVRPGRRACRRVGRWRGGGGGCRRRRGRGRRRRGSGRLGLLPDNIQRRRVGTRLPGLVVHAVGGGRRYVEVYLPVAGDRRCHVGLGPEPFAGRS